MIMEKFKKLYNKWIDLERKTRKYGTNINLHPSEIHAIEIIGKNFDMNITQIANHLGIRLASASELINKLKKKKMVVKYYLEDNKKSKLVKLTLLGQQAFDGHQKFHKKFDDGRKFLENYEDQDKLIAIEDFLDYYTIILDEMLKED